MTTASALRLRKFRERQATGKAVLSVEVCLSVHCDMLVAAGFLEQWDDNSRVAIERATARLLEAWAKEHEMRFAFLDTDTVW
jgi:hypothetical protein